MSYCYEMKLKKQWRLQKDGSYSKIVRGKSRMLWRRRRIALCGARQIALENRVAKSMCDDGATRTVTNPNARLPIISTTLAHISNARQICRLYDIGSCLGFVGRWQSPAQQSELRMLHVPLSINPIVIEEAEPSELFSAKGVGEPASSAWLRRLQKTLWHRRRVRIRQIPLTT
jgi:hypothetical protein